MNARAAAVTLRTSPRVPRAPRAVGGMGPIGLLVCIALGTGCDSGSSGAAAPATVAPAAPPAPTMAVSPVAEPPRAPEIILDASSVSIGTDRVSTGEPGLAEKIAVFLTGRPAIADQGVDFVAMRNAKPSQVAMVAAALHRAKANAVTVKTDTRDGTTQKLALSFATTVAACATVAWIAKDAAIDVWPAGGGTAKRIIKGMAGPDMTLGTEAVARQGAGCGAPELVVGADDRLTWGLVFDLATMSLTAPGARAFRALLVTGAVPGKKLALDSP
jgi:hypothetical protein